MTFRRALTLFDVTNITVGAIVGADIYIASAITAGMLGPASLLAWLGAGVLASVLALTLAECAALVPAVGGPFAYCTRAFGKLTGFMAGWSMWIAELTALPVFAIAFTNYLAYFVQLGAVATHSIRVLFLLLLTAVNVVSVRAAGRANDALTLLKLVPLLVLVVGGAGYVVLHWAEASERLTPFAPLGWRSFPTALVLIFWAYVGFELSTVPSEEVENPRSTIPRAIMAGMAIVTAFYLTTNVVVYALVDHEELARSTVPLVTAATVVFGGAGAAVVAVGAMISVSGSDESDMLGSSRLGYAMAADGLLPHKLADLHGRFGTPYIALITQAAAAAALTFVDRIPNLISFAVVNLTFAFLLCALALMKLQSASDERVTTYRRAVPFAGTVIACGLLIATSAEAKLFGGLVLLIGLAVYGLGAPRSELPEAVGRLYERERMLRRLARRRMRFLGAMVAWLGGHRS